MDTRPIFDYLTEIMDRKRFALYSKRTGSLSEALQKYEDYISKMETEFEAGVFQCMAESARFEEQLVVVANKLGRVITISQRKESAGTLDDSMRVATKMAERSLLFLKENYNIATKALGVEVKEEQVEKPVKKTGEAAYLNGKEVASLFGIAYNNIKDKTWRDRKGFPYLQPSGANGKVVYVKDEVENWIKQNGNRG